MPHTAHPRAWATFLAATCELLLALLLLAQPREMAEFSGETASGSSASEVVLEVA